MKPAEEKNFVTKLNAERSLQNTDISFQKEMQEKFEPLKETIKKKSECKIELLPKVNFQLSLLKYWQHVLLQEKTEATTYIEDGGNFSSFRSQFAKEITGQIVQKDSKWILTESGTGKEVDLPITVHNPQKPEEWQKWVEEWECVSFSNVPPLRRKRKDGQEVCVFWRHLEVPKDQQQGVANNNLKEGVTSSLERARQQLDLASIEDMPGFDALNPANNFFTTWNAVAGVGSFGTEEERDATSRKWSAQAKTLAAKGYFEDDYEHLPGISFTTDPRDTVMACQVMSDSVVIEIEVPAEEIYFAGNPEGDNSGSVIQEYEWGQKLNEQIKKGEKITLVQEPDGYESEFSGLTQIPPEYVSSVYTSEHGVFTV